MLEPLEAATAKTFTNGRRRKPGSWPLLYLGFVLSGEVDMKPFHSRWASSELWAECGFGPRPPYRTMYHHFVRLERHVEAFVASANELIGRARRHESRIGVHVHFDGTALHSHASLEHFCPDKVACGALKYQPAKVLRKASSELVVAERAREAERPLEEVEKKAKAIRRLPKAEAEKLGLDAEHFAWFKQAGHFFRCRDVESGGRRYDTASARKGLYWVGGYFQPGIDNFMGAPLAVNVFGAHRQEYHGFADTFERVRRAIGDEPVSAVFDRGFVHKETFENLIRREVAPISPWRAPNKGMESHDLETEEFDEDGTVRCKHCHGPTTQEGGSLGLFLDDRGKPRLRVRCRTSMAAACATPFSISAVKEPRLLNPISRLNRLPHALLAARDNTENTFNNWRARYKIGGEGLNARPKRIQSISVQTLRASAALLLEWFRICLRHGWLGSHRRRNREQPRPRNGGHGELRQAQATRVKRLLDLPFRGDIARMIAARTGAPPPPAAAP